MADEIIGRVVFCIFAVCVGAAVAWCFVYLPDIIKEWKDNK